MSPNPQGYNNEALPFIAQDHERRLQALEREKLATEVALVKRDVSDIKSTQERRFDELEAKVDTLMTERSERTGNRTSWKAVWVYLVGGAVAIAAMAGPFITYVTSR